MDEEREAIGKFDARRIIVIYCDGAFLPFLDCLNCYTCIDLLIIMYM